MEPANFIHQVRTISAYNLDELDRQTNEYLVNTRTQIVNESICIQLCVTEITHGNNPRIMYTVLIDYDLLLTTGGESSGSAD